MSQKKKRKFPKGDTITLLLSNGKLYMEFQLLIKL